jgi:hypothetical protein
MAAVMALADVAAGRSGVGVEVADSAPFSSVFGILFQVFEKFCVISCSSASFKHIFIFNLQVLFSV